MSLLKFLKAGKSLVGGRESAGRYRVTDPPTLPKFEARKNPFRDMARAKRADALSKASAPRNTLEARSLAPSPECKAFPVAGPGSDMELGSRPGGSNWRNRLSWATALFSWKRGGKSEEEKTSRLAMKGLFFWSRSKEMALARPKSPMVQSELSLDGVKVVRNDLSDSDLEILPANNVPTSLAAKELSSPKPTRAEAGRNRLGILGTTKP